MLCILLLLQDTVINLDDNNSGTLSINVIPDSNGSKFLTINTSVDFDPSEYSSLPCHKSIIFPIIKTHLDVQEWCESPAFSESSINSFTISNNFKLTQII